MPGEKFEIKTYSVSTVYMDGFRQLTILLTSVPLTHNIIFKVTLTFDSEPNPYHKFDGIGVGKNLEGKNFDPKTLSIRCPTDYFNQLYAVLSMEKPLNFSFIYAKWPEPDPAKAADKLITHMVLTTTDEAPGDFEGAMAKASFGISPAVKSSN